MLSKKYDSIKIVPKTREEIFQQILSRPRNKHAKIRLVIPKFKPKQHQE